MEAPAILLRAPRSPISRHKWCIFSVYVFTLSVLRTSDSVPLEKVSCSRASHVEYHMLTAGFVVSLVADSVAVSIRPC